MLTNVLLAGVLAGLCGVLALQWSLRRELRRWRQSDLRSRLPSTDSDDRPLRADPIDGRIPRVQKLLRDWRRQVQPFSSSVPSPTRAASSSKAAAGGVTSSGSAEREKTDGA